MNVLISAECFINNSIFALYADVEGIPGDDPIGAPVKCTGEPADEGNDPDASNPLHGSNYTVYTLGYHREEVAAGWERVRIMGKVALRAARDRRCPLIAEERSSRRWTESVTFWEDAGCGIFFGLSSMSEHLLLLAWRPAPPAPSALPLPLLGQAPNLDYA